MQTDGGNIVVISKGICAAALKDVASKYIDVADIDNFLLEHEVRVKELMTTEALINVTEAETRIAKEMAEEVKAKALLDKRNAAKQALITLQKFNWIKENYSKKDWNTALKHMLGGTMGEFKPGASDSVAKRMDALRQKAESSFLDEIQRNNYDKFYFDEANHMAIMVELSELKPNGQPGRSGSEMAKEVANIMERHQEFWRQEANRQGAFIEKLPGYSIAQTHDVMKLTPHKIDGKMETVEDAFKRWADFIKPKLDWGRTFKGMKTDKVLREIWDGLSTGVHLTYDQGIGINVGGNRAQRLSNSRKLHFKDGESFYLYNQEYGMGNLVYGYNQGLQRLAKNSALIGEMGVNPKKLIDDLYDVMKISTSRSGEALDRSIMSVGDMDYHWDPGVKNLFIEVTGKNKVPASNTLAQIGTIARGVNSMCKLGMATISSFSDIATQISQATYMGISRSESLMNIGKTLTDISRKGMTPAEKQMLSSFGLVAESLISNLHEHINAGSMGNGWLAKAQNRYFKMIGLDWWTTSLKKSMALSLNHDLGEFLANGKQFGELRGTMQKMLESYNLGQNEMKLLKSMPLIKENGRNFIDANYVQHIPDDIVARYLGITDKEAGYATKIKNTKIDLETKLRSFVYDRVIASVIEPDVNVKAWLNQGTQVGTVSGEIARSVGQFKSFAISIIARAVNPWIFNTSGMERAMGLGEMMLATTALGYLAISCKDVVRGKTPPELNEKTALRAMLQGGALGLFGDILFGESTTNASLVGSMAGPVGNMIDDAYSVYVAAREGNDAAAMALKKGRNYLPGQNIFWAKLPLDYLLMYRLQEWANPGYLDRMERNLYNRTGQEYWLSPSEFVK